MLDGLLRSPHAIKALCTNKESIMSALLTLHLLGLGIWIGVVAAEVFIEFDGIKDEGSLIKASKLHFLTDIWVEIPAFTLVLVTGLLMINFEKLEGAFLFKVILGVSAIVFNLICVYAVFKRRKYAVIGDIKGMQSTDPIMRLGGAGFIPSFLAAIIFGMYFVYQ